MRSISTLLLSVLLCACNLSKQCHETCVGVSRVPRNVADSILVKEVVLADLGLRPEIRLEESSTTAFLFVAAQDKKYFAKRYGNLAPLVRVEVEGSEGAKDAAMVDGSVVDRATGHEAIIYNVSVTSLQAPVATALGGFFYGNLGGTSYSYDLRLDRGEWRITKKEVSITF